LKAVLFDLDGTLIDSTDAIVGSMFHVFDSLGEVRPTRQAIIDSIGCPLREQLQYLTQRDLDACIALYRPHYAATAREHTTLLPGAREIFAFLKGAGVPMGLATSKKREAAEMLLEHLGVLHYLDVRIGPDEVTHPKPHPEPLLLAATSMGVAPGGRGVCGRHVFRCQRGEGGGHAVHRVDHGILHARRAGGAGAGGGAGQPCGGAGVARGAASRHYFSARACLKRTGKSMLA
jgi:phosphoglycolate phosphatase-like HAD superfamily hydrolase